MRSASFHEESIQEWFLPYRWFIQFWNVYYGTAHFIVTLGVFVLLFVKRADVFPQWRNTLAAMTALAIIGFAWFPLMPPRLLDSRARPGQPSSSAAPASRATPLGEDKTFTGDNGFGFVDTLSVYGGPWSIRLRRGGVDLQPVRRDAEPAHRLVDLVRARRLAAPATSMDEGRSCCCIPRSRSSASS